MIKVQLFRLNSTYYPDNTVPPVNFDELIWVERYREPGDFTLTVIDDIRILDVLPEGCLISHTDTYEVMMVETREITRDAKRKLKVVIKGRSFETFAENRITPGSEKSQVDPITEIENTTGLWLGNGGTVAVMILRCGFQFHASGIPFGAPADVAIPNCEVYTELARPKASQDHLVKRGDLYTRAIEFMALDDAGIKVNRPFGLTTKLVMWVHDGVDRTGATGIYFDAARQDLDDATYFSTIKGSKNYAQVSTWKYSREVEDRNLVAPLTGLQKRQVYVEAFDLKGIPADYTPPADDDNVSARGQLEIDNNPTYSLMDATISVNAQFKIKFNYDVGDLVMVRGEFGVQQIMRVVEHILTVDKDGQRGYPTLRIASL